MKQKKQSIILSFLLFLMLLSIFTSFWNILVSSILTLFLFSLFSSILLKLNKQLFHQTLKIDYLKSLVNNEKNKRNQKKNTDKYQFDFVTKNLEAPIFSLNAYDKITYYNKAVLPFFVKKYTDSPLIGLTYKEVFSPPLISLLSQTLSLEKKTKGTFHYKKQSFEYIAQPIFTETNKIDGFIFLFNDITHLEKIRAAQKKFISHASHELKTPISVIQGASEILKKEIQTPIQLEFLTMIEEETQHMLKLINKLLEQNKLDSDAYLIHCHEIRTQQLFNTVKKRLLHRAKKKKISITLEVQNFFFSADEMLLQQALINLLSNAIHYSPENTTIKLIAYHNSNKVFLEVWDEGIGIPKEMRKKVFTPLYRMPTAQMSNPNGSGLGLSIVKSIVTQHHGTIHVKPRTDIPLGTIFQIILPKK